MYSYLLFSLCPYNPPRLQFVQGSNCLQTNVTSWISITMYKCPYLDQLETFPRMNTIYLHTGYDITITMSYGIIWRNIENRLKISISTRLHDVNGQTIVCHELLCAWGFWLSLFLKNRAALKQGHVVQKQQNSARAQTQRSLLLRGIRNNATDQKSNQNIYCFVRYLRNSRMFWVLL